MRVYLSILSADPNPDGHLRSVGSNQSGFDSDETFNSEISKLTEIFHPCGDTETRKGNSLQKESMAIKELQAPLPSKMPVKA